MKPLSEFYLRKESTTRGYSSQCRSCDKARSAARRRDPATREYQQAYQPVWRAENREKSNGYTDEWRRRNPVKLSLLKRKWRYGLAAEQFEAMLDEQNYECAVCDRPFDPEAGINGVHVDHDHATGVVRGLLCGRCNRGIGQFADNATLLRRAAGYLDSAQMKTWSDLHRADKVQRPAEQETTGPTA